MFLEIPNVLHSEEVARLRQIAKSLNFVDGRVSNPGNETKKNLQADMSDPGYGESTRIMFKALQETQEFNDFALPKRIAPPLLCKYDPEMTYGQHTDNAWVNVQGGRIRTDVSCTIFIADPADYEGGELHIVLGTQEFQFKGEAGSCVVYPSTTLHQVKPVTRGQRLVGITFIESLVPDALKRSIVYELGEVSALEGLSMKLENRTRLESAKSNLMRMWST